MASISLVRELPDSYLDLVEEDAIPRISKTIPRNLSLHRPGIVFAVLLREQV
jgi:hypothetical protein